VVVPSQRTTPILYPLVILFPFFPASTRLPPTRPFRPYPLPVSRRCTWRVPRAAAARFPPLLSHNSIPVLLSSLFLLAFPAGHAQEERRALPIRVHASSRASEPVSSPNLAVLDGRGKNMRAHTWKEDRERKERVIPVG